MYGFSVLGRWGTRGREGVGAPAGSRGSMRHWCLQLTYTLACIIPFPLCPPTPSVCVASTPALCHLYSSLICGCSLFVEVEHIDVLWKRHLWSATHYARGTSTTGWLSLGAWVEGPQLVGWGMGLQEIHSHTCSINNWLLLDCHPPHVHPVPIAHISLGDRSQHVTFPTAVVTNETIPAPADPTQRISFHT